MSFTLNQSVSAVSGVASGLAAAFQAGVPLDVLLPCLPPSVGIKTRINGAVRLTGHGKAPAHPGSNGEWYGLKNWQRGGVSKDILEQAYEASANAGMLIGVPCGERQYIGIDIDLNDMDGALLSRRIIVDEFVGVWGRIAIRETVPHRALLLAALPLDAFPGTKRTFNLTVSQGRGLTGVNAGKIEILTAGQQCVIGGTHISGRPIQWCWTDSPEKKLSGPPINDSLPQFATFDLLLASVRKVLESLRMGGFSSTESKTSGDVGGPAPELEKLAAPSVDKLVTLVNAMPNPASVDRDTYTAVMYAISGARAGLFAKTRSLDMVDDDRIGRAAAEWAARWPGTNGHTAGSVEDELAKWQADWVKPQAQNYAGWVQLLRHAHNFGTEAALLQALAMEDAQDQIPADVLPAGVSIEAAVRPRRTHDWMNQLKRTPATNTAPAKPMPSLENAQIALRYAPSFEGVIRWDAFASRVVISARPPWVHEGLMFAPREIRDDDWPRVKVWLGQHGLNMTTEHVRDAVLMQARDDEFHPVRNYLTELSWNGTPGIDTWLIDHLGVEDTPLNRAIGRKWLIGGVARIMKPGCKMDNTLILEGPQGLRKSSALAVLAGDWFVDHLPDLTSKDAMLQLQGCWIIEIAEMDAFHRSETSRLKAFQSTPRDRFRQPYGLGMQWYPRQCILAATINPGAAGYLKDETGNRRSWTVACGVGWPVGRKIDLVALTAVRDQLWAEAMVAYRSKEPWWIVDAEIEKLAAAAAEQRFDEDAWEHRVSEYLKDKTSATINDILMDSIFPAQNVGAWNNGHSGRVGKILTRLKWRTRGSERPRRYYSPAGVAINTERAK